MQVLRDGSIETREVSPDDCTESQEMRKAQTTHNEVVVNKELAAAARQRATLRSSAMSQGEAEDRDKESGLGNWQVNAIIRLVKQRAY